MQNNIYIYVFVLFVFLLVYLFSLDPIVSISVKWFNIFDCKANITTDSLCNKPVLNPQAQELADVNTEGVISCTTESMNFSFLSNPITGRGTTYPGPLRAFPSWCLIADSIFLFERVDLLVS